ncbi:MAG TPA: hypothetical protein VI524_12460 [Anaerolineales bacterium]|nr:hypothetical protein [Anaerolineales bacterium]
MNSLGKTTAIFVGLAAVFVALLVAANNVPDTLNQTVMVSLGSAIFGSGLTFFLIRITQLDDRK